MSKQTEALKLALEALDSLLSQYYADTTTRDDLEKAEKAITAIREALDEQPPCKTGSQCTSKCEQCRYKYDCDKAEQQQEPNKDGSPCPEFWEWLPKAYNFEGDGNFTKYNMEVAFLAGKQGVTQQQEPTVEDNSQNWRGMDGTTAYWLIQRHADGWSDIGKMMGEWLEANQAQPVQQRHIAYVCPQCHWSLEEQPAQQQEPWPEEPEGHIAGGVQPSTQQARWSERWYGSTERGWWINCGYERIAHLGTEVSSEEVRKIVDAHNATIPAQQQEPVAVARVDDLERGGRVRALAMGLGLDAALYTSPQPSKPWVGLTDEEQTQVAWACGAMSADWLEFAQAIEAKLKEKNA